MSAFIPWSPCTASISIRKISNSLEIAISIVVSWVGRPLGFPLLFPAIAGTRSDHWFGRCGKPDHRVTRFAVPLDLTSAASFPGTPTWAGIQLKEFRLSLSIIFRQILGQSASAKMRLRLKNRVGTNFLFGVVVISFQYIGCGNILLGPEREMRGNRCCFN